MRHYIRTSNDIHFLVDDTVSESIIRNYEWLFFRNKFGKRETFTFYRGAVIVRHTVDIDRFQRSVRRTVPYVYVCRTCDDPTNYKNYTLWCVSDFEGDLRQAKRKIDKILEGGQL